LPSNRISATTTLPTVSKSSTRSSFDVDHGSYSGVSVALLVAWSAAKPPTIGLRPLTFDLRPTACGLTHVLDEDLLTWLSNLCHWRAGTIGAINSHSALGTVVIGIQVV
jgi:hypothetical protein